MKQSLTHTHQIVVSLLFQNIYFFVNVVNIFINPPQQQQGDIPKQFLVFTITINTSEKEIQIQINTTGKKPTTFIHFFRTVNW